MTIFVMLIICHVSLALLDLITLIKFCEEYKLGTVMRDLKEP
jgi:hypothetical protein